MNRPSFRNWFQPLFSLDMMPYLAWAVFAVGVGAFLITLALVNGELAEAGSLFFVVAVGVAVVFFVIWMNRDAYKTASDIHRMHQKEKKVGADGDMSEVANLPKMPPWMGC